MSAVTIAEPPELLAHYDAGRAYDELLQPGREPRQHYQSLYKHLLSLPPDELNRRQSAADLSFLNQGITFTVYGSTEGTERIFPYDLIPRIITRSEWSTIDRGLRQRLTALNLFLHDIYHEGKIVKDGVVPVDMVYSAGTTAARCASWTCRAASTSPWTAPTWCGLTTASFWCWRTTCACPAAFPTCWPTAR